MHEKQCPLFTLAVKSILNVKSSNSFTFAKLYMADLYLKGNIKLLPLFKLHAFPCKT